jgi:mRNA interferase MazF
MMHRGDIVIIAQKGVYGGRPRPAVVVQHEELLADHPSILVCLLTATAEAMTGAFYRIPVEPSSANGLEAASIIHVDKIATVRMKNIGQVIGRLDEKTLGRLIPRSHCFKGSIERGVPGR